MRPALISKDGHYEPAILHAYIRNELSPETSGEISNHLAQCHQCRELCDFVDSGGRLLVSEPVPEFSPLVWRRIEVQLERQRKQQMDRHLGGYPSSLAWLRRPVSLVAIAGAFAMALVFVVPKFLSDKNPRLVETRPLLAKSAVKSMPVDGRRVSLESGRQFHIRGNALARITDSPRQMPVFTLGPGELEITELLTNSESSAPLGLVAPGFRAVANSSDFAVSYWSRSIDLAVSEGVVEIEQPKTAVQTIKPGQATRISLPPPAPKTAKPGRPTIAAKRSSQLAVSPATSQATPKTEVDVIAPDRSDIEILWESAVSAYYQQGKREVAIELLEQIVRENPDGAVRRKALGLMCEAMISLKRGPEAAKYCEQSLYYETVVENRRSLHRRLGSVYREMVGDCQKAIEHFSKALAFGGSSLLDERTILGRAFCAYELGDVGLAESDVKLLTSRGAKLIRKIEVKELLHLLKTGQNTKVKN